MFNRLKLVKIWIVTMALCWSFVVPPASGQDNLQSITSRRTEAKTECNQVAVTDYPLNNLVNAIIEKCGRKPIYTEDLSTENVTVESFTGDALSHLAGKYFLSIQPAHFLPGAFTKQAGYAAGGKPRNNDPNISVVCLTHDPVSNGKPRPIAKGKLRLYQDRNGLYQIRSNMASAKLVIDLLYRLYGDDPAGQAKRLAENVTRKLFDLGVDLEKGDVKVSLDEAAKQLDDKLEQQLTKKIFAAHLASEQEDPETEMWPLIFVHSKISSTSTSADDSVDKMITALNNVFGEKSVQRSRQVLLISGTAEKRVAIKRLLAEYDVPWSQVQMNMWTVQVSGQPEKVMPRLLAIKNDIAQTQAAMDEVRQRLNLKINARQSAYARNGRLDELRRIGFNCQAEDVLTLNEMLIFLALHDEPAAIVSELNDELEGVLNRLGAKVTKYNKDVREAYNLKNEDLQVSWPSDREHTLKKTQELYRSSLIPRAHHAISTFTASLLHYRADKQDTNAPANLRRDSAAVDRLLQGAMDAYAEDMQRIFLDPLLLRIQNLNGGTPKRQSWGSEGVALVGQTRLVVTSSLTTSFETTVASYANTTRPKPFDVGTLLGTAFPRQEQFPVLGTTSTTSTPTPTATPAATPTPQTLTGASRIFAGLEPGAAFLLAAALANDVEPNFHEVTPGITIKIQPTVLPDGSAARLALDCEFKVETQEFGNKDNVWKQPFADSVKRHKVVTDAAVGVFDLFDISSFSLQSSYPQAPYYVPVIGRLPVVGPAFQWPRDKKRVHHESIVLVNTIILPRALDLARYYGEGEQ